MKKGICSLSVLFIMLCAGTLFAQDLTTGLSAKAILPGIMLPLTAIASMWLTNLVKRITPKFEQSAAGKRLLPIAGCVAGAAIQGFTNHVPLSQIGDTLLNGVYTGLAANGLYQTGPVIQQGLNGLLGLVFKTSPPVTLPKVG